MTKATTIPGPVKVKVADVHPNPWNPNKQTDFIYEKELQSIRRHGFIDPVTVRETKDGLEIVDGEHRWRAAQELGIKTIPVINLGPLGDKEARQLTIILNEVKGTADPFKLSTIVKEVGDEYRDDLPFTKDELENYLQIAAFDPSASGPMTGGKAAEPIPEGFVDITFKLEPHVVDVLTKAIKRVLGLAKFRGKTAHGQALELICADFEAGATNEND